MTGPKNWLDNADSYICPVCGFEANNPNKLKRKMCPRCGFIADKDMTGDFDDLSPEAQKLYTAIVTGYILKGDKP